MNAGAKIIRDHLVKTGTPLFTANGTRVYFRQLPQGFTNTQSAIVLTVADESTQMNGADSMVLANMRLYSGAQTSASVDALYESLHKRLHDVAEGKINKGRVDRAQDSTDPDTGWPLKLVTARIRIEQGA